MGCWTEFEAYLSGSADQLMIDYRQLFELLRLLPRGFGALAGPLSHRGCVANIPTVVNDRDVLAAVVTQPLACGAGAGARAAGSGARAVAG